MTRVALLITSFNGRKYLGDCLRTLIDSNDADLQTSIVVADNASSDGSADFVAREFPDVELIRLSDNRGFAGGINAAWKYAREKFPDVKYVGVVNQDVSVQPGWLKTLAARLDANPATAAVQPK